MASITDRFHPIRAAGENLLYDYQDTVIGRSMIVLYLGASTVATSSEDYHLAGTDFYSAPVQTELNPNTADWTKNLDLDFDITVNKPFTLQGEGFITIPSGCKANTDFGSNGWYIIAKLRHYDGTTETDLVTAQSDTHTNGTYGERDNLPLNISTAKDFAVDDTLRITIEFWSKGDYSTAPNTLALGHDPQNRNGLDLGESTFTLHSSVGTIAKAWLPAKVPE